MTADKENFYISNGGIIKIDARKGGKIEITNVDESHFPDAFIVPREYVEIFKSDFHDIN